MIHIAGCDNGNSEFQSTLPVSTERDIIIKIPKGHYDYSFNPLSLYQQREIQRENKNSRYSEQFQSTLPVSTERDEIKLH